MKIVPFFALLLLLLSFTGQSQVAVLSATLAKQVSAAVGVDRTELIAFAKQYIGAPYRRACSAEFEGI